MNPPETMPELKSEVRLPDGLTQSQQRVCRIVADAGGEEAAGWHDWSWQMRHRIKTKEVLSQVIELTESESQGIDQLNGQLTMAISPYFAALMDPEDPHCPIRRQCVPLAEELDEYPEEMSDPCGEEKNSPVYGLVHRYPDRVLFLVSEICATYCRYCTRSRMVGDGKQKMSTAAYDAAFQYIREHKEVRDVLLSGGDPLTLSDGLLDYLLSQAKSIPHVEFVRIGTRVPVTLPQRINDSLIAVLKKHSPVWMSIHFSHFNEITPQVKEACGRLADAGIPLGSQTVLLKGINDHPLVMKKLMHELLKVRVRPYYIYQCDPIRGSRHFRTPVASGIKVMDQLRGHTTGYAVPTYVIDAPGGGGKIPVGPDYVLSCQDGKYSLKNYEGTEFTYIDID